MPAYPEPAEACRREWTAGAKALQPPMADSLADAGGSTDIEDALARSTVQDGLNKRQTLGHKGLSLPGHRASPREAPKCIPH